jgi:transcription initiation factor TFIIB
MESINDDDWSKILAMKDEEHTEKISIEKYLKSQKQRDVICAECGEGVFEQHFSDGFEVCLNCGVVKEGIIDNSAEWRCFTNSAGGKDYSNVRCGDAASALFPETQLNTYIGGRDKRLQRVHQWTNLTPKERNLHQIYKEFEQIGTNNRLGKNVIGCAADFYSQLYSEMENQNCGVKRCNVRQGLKAACLYFACKRMNTPRERKEIAEMLKTSTKIVTKGCNSFLDIMGGDFIKMDPFKPQDFVERFSQALDIQYPMQKKLERVVEYVAGLDELADSTPTSVTAACIYFLAVEQGLDITKGDLHEKCGSSEVIVGKMYSKFEPHREEMLKVI